MQAIQNMYIRNGALVIISRVKTIGKFFKQQIFSIRVQLFLILCLFALVPVLFLDIYIQFMSVNQQVQAQADLQQYQCNVLATQLSQMNYLETENTEQTSDISENDRNVIESQIDLLADVFDGRIVIVNRAFRVIKDTYRLDQGKYQIGENVIKCYKGKNTYQYCEEKGYMEFTLPIYDASMQQVNGVLLATTSTQRIMDVAEKSHKSMQVMGIISCILLIILAFILSWLFMRPFLNLIQEMNQTSIRMEPVTIPNNLETAQIAQTYNEILVRLKHMDESRQEFVSNVSHELKTPITSVRVLADTLLSMGDVPPEMYQDFLSDISREIDREGTIIEDLLAMVRLEQTGAELEVAPGNINELLERVLKRLRPIAAEREIEVYLESFRPVIADIDEVKLERAFTNLVENAIKYNNDGGWVRVSLNADHNYFYVKIVDNGVGIPEDAVDKIFERFYRVDKARSRNTGGTGLGLSITRTIIRLHRGVIKVHSEYGSGTTFHIRIPLNYMK